MNALYPWQKVNWQRIQPQIGQCKALALLLAGSIGMGKQHFAEQLAMLALCQQPILSDHTLGLIGACGRCPICRLVMPTCTHPDLHNLSVGEGKSITVDQIRQLCEQLSITPKQAKRRVVIISPAEYMNKSASNALLKTLEELPARTLIILVSHRPRCLLPTILSRCQLLKFSPQPGTEGIRWLRKQLADEAGQAEQLLNLLDGAPLRALAWAKQDNRQWRENFLTTCLSPERKDPLDCAATYKTANIINLIHTWQILLIDLLQLAQLGQKAQLRLNHPQLTRLHQAKPQLNRRRLLVFYDQLLATQANAQNSTALNTQLTLERLFILWQDISNP